MAGSNCISCHLVDSSARPDQTRPYLGTILDAKRCDPIRSIPNPTSPGNESRTQLPSYGCVPVCLTECACLCVCVCVYVSGSNARTEPGLSCLIVCQSPHNMLSYMCVSLFDCVLCGCVLAVHNVRCLMSAVPCLLSTLASCCTAWQTTSASTLTPTPAQTLAKTTLTGDQLPLQGI